MDTATISRRFPLVPRPPCTPLAIRAGSISDLASAAARDRDLAAASAVFNQAALLASDCGAADLANHWCRRHALTYLHACPLDARTARLALEPVVNLARLLIRGGNGDAAYTLLDTLYRAVCNQADTVAGGIMIPVSRLTRTADDLHEVRRWLWTVHLADSPRALISAGRWHAALAHLETCNGIGKRLLDGRQVAVITRYLDADTSSALALLHDSVTTEPWEEVITYCLTMLCAPGQAGSRTQRTILDIYAQLFGSPQLAVFVTRLGLTLLDTTSGARSRDMQIAARDLIAHAISWQDGYASRDILAHPGCLALVTKAEQRDLIRIAGLCGLGRGTVPAEVEGHLASALRAAEQIMLQHQHCPPGH